MVAGILFQICVNIFSDVRYSLSAVRLYVCRLSVTLVHPTHAVIIFGNISTVLCMPAIRGHPRKILRTTSQGNPSIGGMKHDRGSQIGDFRPIEDYISETVHDRR